MWALFKTWTLSVFLIPRPSTMPDTQGGDHYLINLLDSNVYPSDLWPHSRREALWGTVNQHSSNRPRRTIKFFSSRTSKMLLINKTRHAGSLKKQESSRKTSISALLTMPKPSTVWITINCGKFWKRWEYQTTWPASWETCMQVRKQQLELDMEQQTGSKKE